MKTEVITDYDGWSFKMPKLTTEMVCELMLGTFDLADFTFGTARGVGFIPSSQDIPMHWLERILWRIENVFRFIEWWLWLQANWYDKKHRLFWMMLHFPFCKIRLLLFNLAWAASMRQIERYHCREEKRLEKLCRIVDEVVNV